jgi:hypothetical protein
VGSRSLLSLNAPLDNSRRSGRTTPRSPGHDCAGVWSVPGPKGVSDPAPTLAGCRSSWRAFAEESFHENARCGFRVLAAAALPVDRHEAVLQVRGCRRCTTLHWYSMAHQEKLDVAKRIAEFDELQLVSVGTPVRSRREKRSRAVPAVAGHRPPRRRPPSCACCATTTNTPQRRLEMSPPDLTLARRPNTPCGRGIATWYTGAFLLREAPSAGSAGSR